MSEKKKQNRQPYEKPSVKEIQLVADEVLAVGCKTSSVNSGPIVNGTFTCLATSQCFESGS